MLILSNKIENQAVLSLRTGGRIATATAPIINPNNFLIAGFFCDDKFSGEELILLTTDIREHIKRGLVIDDHEVLADPNDLIRLKKIIEINYKPKGKLVVTELGHKLGKLTDYAVDSESLYIQKLYVTPLLIKGFTGAQLSIDRKQILEATDTKIVVKDATVKSSSKRKKRTVLSMIKQIAEPARAHTSSSSKTDLISS